jgi:hypothetical protein
MEEHYYRRMPYDVEMPTVSDDQQALHLEERAIADIYKARKERRQRILRQSVPLFIRNKDRILANAKMARCHIDGIRFGLAYSGEWNIPVAFLGGLLRLWENPLFQAECPKCHETAYFTSGGGSPLSGMRDLAMTCATCGHIFGANKSKVQTTVIDFGKALLASIKNSNAGLGSMEDENLPIEDVVHTLELEEYQAKKEA